MNGPQPKDKRGRIAGAMRRYGLGAGLAIALAVSCASTVRTAATHQDVMSMIDSESQRWAQEPESDTTIPTGQVRELLHGTLRSTYVLVQVNQLLGVAHGLVIGASAAALVMSAGGWAKRRRAASKDRSERGTENR